MPKARKTARHARAGGRVRRPLQVAKRSALHAARKRTLETTSAVGQKGASLLGRTSVASHATPRASPVQPKSAIPE